MKKKQFIVINGRFLSQGFTGVQRFAFEMTKALAALGYDIIVVAPRNILLGHPLNCKIRKWGCLRGHFWEQIGLFVYLKLHRNPLLINFSGLGPVFYKNQVCTIHDLSFMVHPEWFSKMYYHFYRLCAPVLSKNSKKIITVSDFSKNEIVRLLNINPGKIIIINNAVDFSDLWPSRPEKLPEGKFILTVGSVDPRKNQVKMAEAFSLSSAGKFYNLVLAGKSGQLFASVELSKSSFVSLGYVADEELIYLYKNASLFVYLSLYEGFGIPPLEAMSFGCPVVLSDIPAFREIFGNAAYYVDPYDISTIAEGIDHVLSNAPARNELIAKGYKLCASYSWKKSALKFVEMIERELL